MTTSSQNAITLQSLILNRIEQQNLSYSQITQSMGYLSNYKTQMKALKRLQHVLSSSNLGLTETSYDFKYSSAEFIHTLCHVLGINKSDYLPLLHQLEQYAHKVLNAITPIVYADVTFNDDFKPSFVSMMAVSRFTRIRLDDDIRLLDKSQQLQVIHALVKQHHATMTGNIPFDGVINGYRISFEDREEQEQRLYIPAIFE